MSTERFQSFAQNGEDVVLWRALGHLDSGSYIDVGANHPTVDSVSRAFYDHGWRGVLVEPVPEYAALLRKEREGDQIVEAAIMAGPPSTVTLHEVPGTGLSTLIPAYRDAHLESGRSSRELTVPTRSLDDVLEEGGWTGRDIHFLSIDTEGAELTVLQSIDLRRWRPWVLVIEATAPNTSEPTHSAWQHLVTGAGYQFRLFDGLSRFYVADERAAELADRLSYPATVLDHFSTLSQRGDEQEIRRLNELLQARSQELDAALTRAAELGGQHHELSQAHHELSQAHHLQAGQQQELRDERNRLAARVRELSDELAALRGSLAWRASRPLRLIERGLSRRRA
jgi:FkbM family methyltransferase